MWGDGSKSQGAWSPKKCEDSDMGGTKIVKKNKILRDKIGEVRKMLNHFWAVSGMLPQHSEKLLHREVS